MSEKVAVPNLKSIYEGLLTGRKTMLIGWAGLGTVLNEMQAGALTNDQAIGQGLGWLAVVFGASKLERIAGLLKEFLQTINKFIAALEANKPPAPPQAPGNGG